VGRPTTRSIITLQTQPRTDPIYNVNDVIAAGIFVEVNILIGLAPRAAPELLR